MGRYGAVICFLPWHDVPRFLLALFILYILAYKFDVQEIGSFYSSKFGGQPYLLGFMAFNWAKLWNLFQHIWPVILVATFGRLACNMRVMRANLRGYAQCGISLMR